MVWTALLCLACLPTAGHDGALAPALALGSPYPEAPQEPEVDEVEDVIVTARRGAALFEAETALDQAQIDAIGAYDIGEVLERLRQGYGLDGPALLIVNGRRVTNAGDFLSFPPDALERLEILPAPAAAAYGGQPSQRVVNLVVKPRFVSRDGLASAARPTDGGRASVIADLRQSSIRDTEVDQYGLRLSRDTALYGGERSVYLSDHPDRAGVALRPAIDTVAANLSLRRALGDWAGSLSGRVQRRVDRGSVLFRGQIVETRRESDNAALSGGLSGALAGWAVRGSADLSLIRADQRGLAEIQSRSAAMTIDLGAGRTLADLPAGPMIANLNGRVGRFDGRVSLPGEERRRRDDTADLNGTLTVPLWRVEPADGGGWNWGEGSLSLGGGVRRSGGAEGSAFNAGLFWSPTRKVRLNARWSTSREGPNAAQRFDPVFFGEPRTVFDFPTGEAVEVLPLLGGNPDLGPQTTEQTAISASVGPYTDWAWQGGLDLQNQSATDGIGGLPALTPQIEALFPDRFQRDPDGRLTVIDQRPLNLGGSRLTTLSANLAFTAPLGDGQSVRAALTHGWQLTNRLQLAPGLAEFDRLDGDGGGVPRRTASLLLDGRFGRLGLNVTASWRDAARIRRLAGVNGPDDLRLDDFSTVDVKFTYRIGGAEGGSPVARLELEIDNLFDARPGAQLGDGRPAPGYGRDDQDPVGRTVRLNVNRRF